MGILNDLKKIFFGASAVSKTAKDKTVDFVKETGEDVRSSPPQLLLFRPHAPEAFEQA